MSSEAESQLASADGAGAAGDGASLLGIALTTLGLSGFAVAQPLYDLLASNVTFLIAHDADRFDVVAIAALILLVPGALAFAGVGCARLASPSVAAAALALLVGLGVATAALPPIHRTLPAPGALTAGLAIALGVGAAFAHWRSEQVRSYARLLGLGAGLFPLWFLLGSPAAALVLAERSATPRVEVRATTPVVFVVFDQFPLFTLLDADETIDRARYPNFAALADESDWFRNATTVAGETVLALPALLTGRYPDEPRLPRFSDYPQNLFSLLGHDYQLNVTQTMTDLCPAELCPTNVAPQTRREHLGSILDDLGFLYLHIVLPPDLRGGLPDVGSTWRDFSTSVWRARDATVDDPKSSWGDPTSAFERFIAGFDGRQERVLHFLHINIPHVPWKYLPSGAVYGPVGRHLYPYPMNGLADVGADAGWALDRALQRHLLQVGFTDRLLGDLVQRLKHEGIYDSALLIVTADHGITFWPTTGLAPNDQRTASDVLNIPLLVKRPRQRTGRIDDRNAETIDLLPTIAALLEIKLPEPVDGHSLYDSAAPKRQGKRVYIDRGGSLARIDYASRIAGRRLSVARMKRVLGESSDPFGLFAIGRHREWIGKPIEALPRSEGPGRYAVELEFADAFRRVDPQGSFVPARITGAVSSTAEGPAPREVAISINGILWATTRTFQSVQGAAGFDAMVPQAAFRRGANEVDVYTIDGSGDDAKLAALPKRARRDFALVEAPGNALALHSSDGLEIPVVPGALTGRVDTLGAMLAGWARDEDGEQLPDSILVFANGRFYEERDLARSRRETAERAHIQDTDRRTLRFDMVIPFEILREAERPELRVFAISRGVASELDYPDDFAYRPQSRH